MKTQKTFGFSALTLAIAMALSGVLSLGCSYAIGSINDEFGARVVEIGTDLNQAAYVLGSRFELNRVGTDQATVEVGDSSVFGVERTDPRTYLAEARSQGTVTVTLRESGDLGTTTITVAQPDSIELAERAVFVRGGLARTQLHFSAAGQTLRARDVITFAENAQVILPERGQDELWVRGVGADEMLVTVTVNEEVFELPIDLVDTAPVEQVVVRGLGQRRYEAQLRRADGARILGADIIWSLDGVDLPAAADSPGDHYLSALGGGEEHELCARAGAAEGCLMIYQTSTPGLVD